MSNGGKAHKEESERIWQYLSKDIQKRYLLRLEGGTNEGHWEQVSEILFDLTLNKETN
jgi:hypothetical protein